MPTRGLLRAAAIAALAGATAQLLATVFEPRRGDGLTDDLRVVAASTLWNYNRLLDLIGVFLTVGALSVVARTFTETPGRDWARVGQPFFLLMGALGATAVLAGANLKEVADSWADATPAAKQSYAAAFDAATNWTDALFFGAFMALGLYLATLAAAILTAHVYARWIGWASAVSAGLVLSGNLLLLAADAAFVAVLAGFAVFLVVLAALGVALWRPAASPTPDASRPVAADMAGAVTRADALAVQTLGAFAVLRGGLPVPLGAWQSRKARDVLKILVARRGRPVRRDVLMEALWPEQDPARTANRLSVALSILRGVLDPGRGAAPVIVADRYAVALDTARVEIDVEAFLALAADSLDRWRYGSREKGLAALEAAERAYTGDFLDDEPDAEWAVTLREEARAAYLAVAELLASASSDPERAVGYRLHMLELDPYDEGSHLALVAGLAALGRHGEALRAHGRYRTRMHAIGVEPVPAPAARDLTAALRAA